MIKKMLKMLSGVVLAALVVVIAVPFFVDANNFKGTLSEKLSGATGYKVVMKGDIALSLFPSVHFSAKKVAVNSMTEETGRPFVEVEALEVGIKLLPLLSRRVEVSNITLKKPVIALRKYAGRGNWQTVESLQTQQLPIGPKGPAKKGAGGGDFTISTAKIIGGELSYRDLDNDKAITISGLDLDMHRGSSLNVDAKGIWNEKSFSLAVDSETSGKTKAKFTSDLLAVQADGKLAADQFQGNVKAKTPSLQTAGQWLSGGKSAAKNSASNALEITGKAACSRALCKLTDATITLDDSVITGAVTVNTQGQKPVFSADLQAKSLDLTPYMTQKTARISWISDAVAADARWNAAPLDLSFLNAVQGKLKLAVEHLVAGKFSADQNTVNAELAGGNVVISATSNALYKGKGGVSLRASTAGDVASNITLTGVEMGALLAALYGEEYGSGKGNMRLTLATKGKSEAQMVSGLNGNGDFSITEGTINGVDLASMIRNVKAAFTGARTAQGKTEFSSLKGSVTITQGIIANNDLLMEAPLFRANGRGTVDLPNYRMDYLLSPEVGKGSAVGGVSVPIRISGPLDNLSYAPDAASVINEAIKNPDAIKKNLKGAKEMLKDAKGLFKGL